MDNLINVYMNYKMNRLTEYGVLLFQQDTVFIRQVMEGYIRTYIDNCYYGIFNTIDDSHFNLKNLKLEFDGIMVEMLEDYRVYELQVSNQEYTDNRKMIEDLNPFCLELIKIDDLEIDNKDSIPAKVEEFIHKNKFFSDKKEVVSKLISLVRETFVTSKKLLDFTDNYYVLSERSFEGQKDIIYLEMVPNIKSLEMYRSSLVQKVYRDDRLEISKIECLLQKVSLLLLRNVLKHDKLNTYFIQFPDGVISRGKIQHSILSLMDNPIIRKHVIVGVSYNTYLNQKIAFVEDYQFGCIQDFTHIHDVYQKTDTIYKEGIFNYLLVWDCKYRDRDYFLGYNPESMKTLVFEED